MEGALDMAKQRSGKATVKSEPAEAYTIQTHHDIDMDFHLNSDFESMSDVDREPINGGSRTSNWKDARENYSREVRTNLQPLLEDGAD